MKPSKGLWVEIEIAAHLTGPLPQAELQYQEGGEKRNLSSSITKGRSTLRRINSLWGCKISGITTQLTLTLQLLLLAILLPFQEGKICSFY